MKCLDVYSEYFVVISTQVFTKLLTINVWYVQPNQDNPDWSGTVRPTTEPLLASEEAPSDVDLHSLHCHQQGLTILSTDTFMYSTFQQSLSQFSLKRIAFCSI